MDKKVQISYTVEMDSVPVEVERLIRNAAGAVDGMAEELETAQEKIVVEKNYIGAALEVDKIRTELTKIDQRLSDCYSILVGYQQAVLDERNENQLNLDFNQGSDELD